MDKSASASFVTSSEAADIRGNVLSPGTWCLVGEREWSRTGSGKNPTVDLLHVYDADHKARLQRDVSRGLARVAWGTHNPHFQTQYILLRKPLRGPIYRQSPLAGVSPGKTDSDVVDVDDI